MGPTQRTIEDERYPHSESVNDDTQDEADDTTKHGTCQIQYPYSIIWIIIYLCYRQHTECNLFKRVIL